MIRRDDDVVAVMVVGVDEKEEWAGLFDLGLSWRVGCPN
jgi:hypothetical protein